LRIRETTRPPGFGSRSLVVSKSHALTLSRSLALTAFLLVLAGMATNADTSFTSTGWLTAVPLPGITVTNSSGQVYVRGNAHVVRLQADDPRVTGRLEAWMDLAYQPDGSARFSGPAYCEVGTWDSSGTNFTPTGGAWTLNYSGVLQADGSAQYNMAGYGIGGAIEGLRISVAATRASPGDATTPYLASGTIKPAPLDIRQVVDDFDDNHFDTDVWPSTGGGSGRLSIIETNQQLTLAGTWSTPTDIVIDHTAWVSAHQSWSVPDGQMVELRADLASLSPAGSACAALGLYNSSGLGFGPTMKSRSHFGLEASDRWSSLQETSAQWIRRPLNLPSDMGEHGSMRTLERENLRL
jgi:hypothetical protein